jgi:hypothetical protein
MTAECALRSARMCALCMALGRLRMTRLAPSWRLCWPRFRTAPALCWTGLLLVEYLKLLFRKRIGFG